MSGLIRRWQNRDLDSVGMNRLLNHVDTNYLIGSSRLNVMMYNISYYRPMRNTVAYVYLVYILYIFIYISFCKNINAYLICIYAVSTPLIEYYCAFSSNNSSSFNIAQCARWFEKREDASVVLVSCYKRNLASGRLHFRFLYLPYLTL